MVRRLLACPGFAAGVQEVVDGEWVIHVETDGVSMRCPECGVVAVGNGRQRVVARASSTGKQNPSPTTTLDRV
jgi:predicted RNA-binding Zn-ribbon protein involved in translation (DUF1610 family)